MWFGAVLCRGLTTLLRAHRTPLEIFIENTDAFQVVFYAQYFKFFQWGLHDAIGDSARLCGVDDMKFKGAAVLGDACEIVTVQTNDSSFEQSIVRDGTVLVSATTTTEAVVPEVDYAYALDHVVRFDDIDRGGALSLDAALRGFERTRTTTLGGAKQLAALLDDNVTVVVARVDELRYRPVPVQVGTNLAFKAQTRVRASRFIVFDQAALLDDAVAATATITCVCVDATTGRPISLPASLRRFEQ